MMVIFYRNPFKKITEEVFERSSDFMKKSFLKVIAVILAAGLVGGSTALADSGGNITITGNFTEKFVLDYDNTNFLQAEYITPGNVYLSHIYLKNMSDKKMDIQISDIEVQADMIGSVSLVDELYLWIYRGDGNEISEYKECLYYGKYSDGRTGYLTLEPYQNETLSVLVALSPDAGNEYQGLTMHSKWNVSAVLSDTQVIIPEETSSPKPENTYQPTTGPIVSDEPMESEEPLNTETPEKAEDPKKTPKPSGGGGGVPHVLTYKYVINYIDTEGNTLAPSIEGEGVGGRDVYAYAKDIPGYKPDKQEKVFWIKAPKTVIDFIYTKVDEEETPMPDENNPKNSSEPVGDDKPSDGDNPNNGDEPENKEDPNESGDGSNPDNEDDDNSGDGSDPDGNNGGENPNGDDGSIPNDGEGLGSGDNDSDENGSGNPENNGENSPNLVTKIFRHNGNSGDDKEPNKPVKTGAEMFENSSKPILFTVLSALLAVVSIPIVFLFKKKKNDKKGGM